MNKFLELSHKALDILHKYEKIHVVIGNEACDLDSAVSALVYAFFLYNHIASEHITIPVLNIHEDEFSLKTETKYFLKKHDISETFLTFRNQIDLTALSKQNKLNLTLVDHHVLPSKDQHLIENVVEVMDHRPFDEASNLKTDNVEIDTVGSCCTLIAKKIMEQHKSILSCDLAHLLHGTIVLDTVNFNQEANRFKELDVKIIEMLEKDFNIIENRANIFENLREARSDVSSLTPLQVLHRDLKTVNGVPIPGVPMLVSQFLKMEGARESLKKFCSKHDVKVCIPMGLTSKGSLVYRDIAVFAMEDCQLQKTITDCLKNHPTLGLEEVDTDVCGLVLFKQNNIKMSRKHIIPILREALQQNKTMCQK